MTHLRTLKLWKQDWTGNKITEGVETKDRAEATVIRDCPADCVVILSHTEKNGRIWTAVKPNRLLELVCENKGIYEVITKFPHKVYFDIDKKGGDEGYLEKIKKIIQRYFAGCEFAVSGSITEEKTSYHIILPNYVIHNKEEQLYMKHLTKYIKDNEDDGFDWVVYRKGNMKCVNQGKKDGRIQAIVENPDLKKHMISCFLPDYAIPFAPAPEQITELIQEERAKGNFDVMTLPKLNLEVPEGIVWLDLEAEQALQLIPAKDLEHQHTRMVARFCKTEGISFEKFVKWNSAKWEARGHSKAKVSEKIQYWKGVWNAKYLAVPFPLEKLKQTFLKQFYKDIAKDIHYSRFEKSFALPADKTEKIGMLSQDEFVGTEKFSIFNIGMGGGKTAQTCDFLRFETEFCWIAPNKALAHNTFNRLEETGIANLKHYSREPTKDKVAKSLMNYDKIIIVANSLHYLFEKQYRVIVIDEIETLIDKWFGNFMTHKAENWAVFLNIIRKAEKVILLDAFITSKTLNLMKAICPKADFRIYERAEEPMTREIHYITDFALCIRNLIDDLKAGLKVFIFYPYKNQSKCNQECVSMEAFYNMLMAETGKMGLFYNSDIDEKIKAGLRDVNTSWKDCNFVITNMMITCGVNYDETDFDKEYLFITNFTSPRDATQVSYRPRTLQTNRINVCFVGKMTQTNSWEVDTEVIADPIYSAMIDSILVEKKSPIRKTLQLFFVKARYSQHTNKEKIQAIIGNQITEMLDKYGASVGYKNVVDIDFSYAEHIKQRIFAGEATMIEKFCLQKFYFKNQFVEEAHTVDYTPVEEDWEGDPTNALEYAWNDNYNYYFQQVKRVLDNPNSVFVRLKELNGWASVFPPDIRKAKISDEIKTQIFKEFKFKYVNPQSKIPKMLEQVYNSYFMRQIVKAEHHQETKHTTYYVNRGGELKYFYDFVEQYRFIAETTESEYDEPASPCSVADQVSEAVVAKKCLGCRQYVCSCNKLIKYFKAVECASPDI